MSTIEVETLDHEETNHRRVLLMKWNLTEIYNTWKFITEIQR